LIAPDLSIVIVTFNSRRDIEKCLHSLQTHCLGVAIEILVLDNASADGTADFIQAHFPAVRLLRSGENLGYARANNLAAKQAKSRYLLFLNPDTWLDDDLATPIVRFLDSHPEAGGCTPRALNPDGSLQVGSVRQLPTLTPLFYDQVGLAQLFPRSRRFGRYRMTWWDHNDQREVEQAMGACLALRREVFETVGGFDESYFMYYEDVELCRAVRDAGWKIFYLPDARVYHVGGQSANQFVMKNFKEWYASMFRYFRKHYGRLTVLLAKSLVAAIETIKVAALGVMMLIPRANQRGNVWNSRRQQLAGHLRILRQLWSL